METVSEQAFAVQSAFVNCAPRRYVPVVVTGNDSQGYQASSPAVVESLFATAANERAAFDEYVKQLDGQIAKGAITWQRPPIMRPHPDKSIYCHDVAY